MGIGRRATGMLFLLSFLGFLVTFVSAFDQNANVNSHNKVVVCYVASWAANRPGKGAYTWENVDPSLCTHIIYSFAGINNLTYAIHSLDPFFDTEENGGEGQYQKFLNLKERQPRLKVSLGVGGWNEGSGKYSNMSSKPENRKAFIDSVLVFLRKHRFDGLDMNWEYPGVRVGHRVEDRENFATLLKEMRVKFNKAGLLLTSAVGASLITINKAYDIPEISKHLDFIHVKAYDYNGYWDGETGHNAPIRLQPANSTTILAQEFRLSVDDTVKYLIELGAPRNKLVLGVPFFGRNFILQDPTLHHKGAMSKGAGFQGPYTREDGFLGYNEICKELLPASREKKNWVQKWDELAQVPYMTSGEKWVSFDNTRSISIKARYAFTEGLAGVTIWAIDNDDFDGECSSVRYPLLRTIHSSLKDAAEEGVVPAVVEPVAAI